MLVAFLSVMGPANREGAIGQTGSVCGAAGSFTPLRQRVDIPQLVIDPFGERRAGQIGDVRCRFADGLDTPELDEGRYPNRRRWQIDQIGRASCRERVCQYV